MIIMLGESLINLANEREQNRTFLKLVRGYRANEHEHTSLEVFGVRQPVHPLRPAKKDIKSRYSTI
jgi:hypothetical protein